MNVSPFLLLVLGFKFLDKRFILVSGTDKYPFGMPMRIGGDSCYRDGFNGQEKANEIKGEGNSYSAEFWEYDPRLGRRWNLYPQPVTSVSLYSGFNNNPIGFSDKFGDSSIVDNKGYLTYYDAKDLRVFMQDGEKLKFVGEIGKTIDANDWFKNLLKENSESADNLIDPGLFGDNFKTRVQQYGIWDYKYRSPANKK